MTTQNASASTDTKHEHAAGPIVVDLGKKSRKRIRQLRKGKPGKLLNQIQSTIDELRKEGVVDGAATPIVVVIRERRRRNRYGMLGMR